MVIGNSTGAEHEGLLLTDRKPFTKLSLPLNMLGCGEMSELAEGARLEIV